MDFSMPRKLFMPQKIDAQIQVNPFEASSLGIGWTVVEC